MPIRVRYFAAARDLAGCEEENISLESTSVTQDELRIKLAQLHPRLEGYLGRMRLALNGDFIEADVDVHDGDEVDILPPVAGGSPVVLCEITEEEISVDRLWRSVAHAGAGGIAIFIGVVRDHAESGPVSRLDYESHRALAQKEMGRILDEIVREHHESRVGAAHRIGSLGVGDIAVVVAASAPHREQAFAACRAAIERIKESVPIWKKEWGLEGDANWVNLEPT